MTAQQYHVEEEDLPPQYEPLIKEKRQIRLLFLKATDGTQEDEPITSLLVPLALDEIKTRYAAVSYFWGTPDKSESIVVNGAEFSISNNLLEFLKAHQRRCQYMPEMRKMPLWIDSICINQTDVSERNSQVALMKSIYQNAGMVISWLGASFHLCDWAFAVMRSFKEQIDNTHDPRASKVTDASWLGHFPQACEQDTSSSGLMKSVVWDSIIELCGLPYWKRIWVFQEIVLGGIVMLQCGDDCIDFMDVVQVSQWLIGLHPSLPKPENMSHSIWERISSSEFTKQVIGLQSILLVSAAREVKQPQGWALINMLRDHEASDPRDKIYGSLGVTNLNITPDYSKSVKEVYVDATATLIREHFELGLMLSGCPSNESDAQSSLTRPSWVPDWTQRTTEMFPFNHPFLASKGHPSSPQPVILGNSLHCSGVVCDEITAVESILAPKDCLNFCSDYISSRKTDRYPTGIPHLRALFLVLLSDWATMVDCRCEPESMIYQVVACGLLYIFHNSEITYKSDTGKSQTSDAFRVLGLGAEKSDLATMFWNKIVGTTTGPSNCVITGPREQQPAALSAIGERIATTVLVALLSSLKDRRIFHTRTGYIGIGLQNIQAGDQVCVAFGCNVPIVLRPQGASYTHVGPCYTVGFMEGEAIVDVQKGRRQVQAFELR